MSPSALITEAELDQLENFLFSDQVAETSLDLIGTHGLLCALNISPVPTPQSQWQEMIFDGQPNWKDDAQKARTEEQLKRLYATIGNDLYGDQEVLLPCELTLDTEDEAELTIWAQGFMEGVFLNEEAWFEVDEETVAGLLLPIMVASDLFDDPEVQDIRKDRALAEEMAEQIPEVLVDLYLYYHAPEK